MDKKKGVLFVKTPDGYAKVMPKIQQQPNIFSFCDNTISSGAGNAQWPSLVYNSYWWLAYHGVIIIDLCVWLTAAMQSIASSASQTPSQRATTAEPSELSIR